MNEHTPTLNERLPEHGTAETPPTTRLPQHELLREKRGGKICP